MKFYHFILFILLGGIFNHSSFGKEASEFIWYDGETPRQIYLKPNLLIEFGNQEKKINKNQLQLIKDFKGVRLWKVTASNIHSFWKNKQSGSTSSEVFTDNLEGGALRALPGGIFIYFDLSMNEEKVRAWLKEKNLVAENGKSSKLFEIIPLT